ncbi:MAG: WG repeat-containing protein, partial [Chlorobiota bacterium]
MDAIHIHPFREGNLTGLRSESGEVVLPPTYERIDPFFGSYAKIVHEGKQGLIDRKGRLALGELFDSVTVRPWGRRIKYIYMISSEGKKGLIPDGTNRFSGFRFDTIGHL